MWKNVPGVGYDSQVLARGILPMPGFVKSQRPVGNTARTMANCVALSAGL